MRVKSKQILTLLLVLTIINYLDSHKLLLYAILVGPCLGSFTAVFVERTKKKISLLGRSSCACGRELKISENIPIIGFLKIRGISTCCNSKIPKFYLMFEIYFGLFFTTLALISDSLFVLGLLFYLLSLLTYKVIFKFSKNT